MAIEHPFLNEKKCWNLSRLFKGKILINIKNKNNNNEYLLSEC